MSDCPECGDSNLHESGEEWSGDQFIINNKCKMCGTVWDDVYEYQGTTITKKGNL